MPERTAQSTAENFAEQAGLARAQTAVTSNEDDDAPQEVNQAFVIYEAPNGDSVCRVATPDEAQEFTRDKGVPLRQINHLEDQDLEPSQSANPGSSPNATAGITINLRGTPQLDANPAAKQAFINAAAKWEAIITDPITVTLDVDFGTTAFGNSFPSSNTLAQTGSTLYSYSYSTVRSRLISDAPVGSAEATLLNSLPASSLPTDIGSISSVFALPSIISALNLPPPASVTVPRITRRAATGSSRVTGRMMISTAATTSVSWTRRCREVSTRRSLPTTYVR